MPLFGINNALEQTISVAFKDCLFATLSKHIFGQSVRRDWGDVRPYFNSLTSTPRYVSFCHFNGSAKDIMYWTTWT